MKTDADVETPVPCSLRPPLVGQRGRNCTGHTRGAAGADPERGPKRSVRKEQRQQGAEVAWDTQGRGRELVLE